MAHAVYLAAVGYATIGVIVAAWFVLWAIERTDPATHGAYAFRPLLIPGAALLWPLVLLRCRRLGAL